MTMIDPADSRPARRVSIKPACRDKYRGKARLSGGGDLVDAKVLLVLGEDFSALHLGLTIGSHVTIPVERGDVTDLYTTATGIPLLGSSR